MPKAAERLVRSFKPEHYQLLLDIDPEKKHFSGSVIIRGRKTGRPSSRITLHQKGLKIKSASIIHHHKNGKQDIELARHNTHKAYDELRIHSKNILYPGSYELSIEFEAGITQQAHGIYPCSYIENGQVKTIIATQFESHHAREAFPCVDEPEAKAVFELELTYPSDMTAISNTPMSNHSDLAPKQTSRFEPTPIMSTYLLALAIGDIAYKETKHGKVTIRTYATPSSLENTDFALKTAKRCLEFYDDYFDTPYPLKKLDMIALPDMGAATLAMENWGLVTYRETAMLFDQKTSSLETKMLVAQVINHELAHQWFGNLVTMRWWNDLWLNESFAHVMEFIATDKLFPEWDIWHYFNEYELDMAFKRDALQGISPIRTAINHPDEIGPNFDRAITYAKGAVVLNMLRHFIGDGAFRAALKNYFSEHAYSNTKVEDLWESMDKAAGQGHSVTEFMNNWINQAGYPLVSVNWRASTKTASLNQKRFLFGQAAGADNPPWHIPLDSQPVLEKQLMDSAQLKLNINPDTKNLILNKNASGYYLVNYTNPGHQKLVNKALVSKELPAVYRSYYVQTMQLLDKAGVIKTEQLLDTLDTLAGETEPTVWKAITSTLAYLQYLLSTDAVLDGRIKLYSRKLIEGVLSRTSWQPEPNETIGQKKLRTYIISAAITAAHPDAMSRASEIFNNSKKFDFLSPELRRFVYEAVISGGDQASFEKLLKTHNDPKTAAEQKDELVYGMTKVAKADQVDTLVGMLRGKHVKHQDLMTSWLRPLLTNPHSRQVTWKWMVGNWDWINDIYGHDHAFERFPYYAAQAFQTDTEFVQYGQFFKGHKKNLALRKSIELGEETIKDKIDWHKRSQQAVKDWLDQHLD